VATPVLCDRYGGPVRPLLQATDPSRFHPGAAEPDTGEPVLFVGNSRGVFRPVIRALVDAGIEVGIYGAQWSPFLGAGAVRAELVSNAKVPALYRAAGVVLNDHWEEMRAHGFVSNRLFDAAACGARVVSDEVAGAEELFGGLVRSYRDEAELVRLVRAGAGEFPGPQARVDLARRVAREHSFDARAVQLLEAALEVKSHTEVD
jgi:O-antigen biosynthesis protein